MEKDGTARLTDSVGERMAQEKRKAYEKYGAISLQPGGHPDYDILDYTINEVVGLHRYGEMMQARADAHEEWPEQVRRELRSFGENLRRFALHEGSNLINIRLDLLQAGHDLGKAEAR